MENNDAEKQAEDKVIADLKKKSHSTSLVCILVNLYSFLFLWLPNPEYQ